MSKNKAGKLAPKFNEGSAINETFSTYEQVIRSKLSQAGFISEEINDMVSKLKSFSPEIIRDRLPQHRPPVNFVTALKDMSADLNLSEIETRRIASANPYLLFEPWEDWKPAKLAKKIPGADYGNKPA